MGSGRDKRKKVKEKAKAKEAAAERAEKQKQKAAGVGAAAEEPVVAVPITPEEKKKKKKLTGMKELTEMINEIRKNDKLRKVVTIEPCASPSPRLNSSFTLVSNTEAIMFGGEFYDGNPVSTFVYNDLFRWHLDKHSWQRIYSINTPPPRCSHQSVVFRDQYFMFGGEFCTSDKFHHHRDFWRLNLTNNTWDEIKSKGGPSARSGHRMAVWRNYIVLFGGFYEAFKETQWFNDLYVFSISTMQWKKINFAPTQPIPSPRSGHQLVVYNDTLVITGGYAKVKRSKKTEAKVHRDMWTLNLAPLLDMQVDKKEEYPEEWVRVPRRGHAPSDRAGAVMVLFRKTAVQFGGVFDGASLNTQPVGFDNTKAKPTATKAIFFNDMFSFDLEGNRWHELPMLIVKDENGRRRKLKEDGTFDQINEEEEEEEEGLPHRQWDGNGALYGSCSTGVADTVKGSGWEGPAWMQDDSTEEVSWPLHTQLSRWAADCLNAEHLLLEQALEAKRLEEEQVTSGKGSSHTTDTGKLDKNRMPLGRLNPSVFLRGHTLIIYGGSFEHKKREWALDDCWSIDLLKRDGWSCLIEGSPIDLAKEGSDDEEDDEDDSEGDSDEEENSDSDDDGEEGAVKLSEIEQLRQDIDRKDPLTPLSEETLRSYFTRTAGQWATIALEESRGLQSGSGSLSQEQLKDSALRLAGEHYGDMLPSVLRLIELEKHEKGGGHVPVKSKTKSSKSSSKSKSGARDPVGMVVRV